jgi:hypothetical protein
MAEQGRRGAKWYLILAGLMVLLIAGAYGAGRWQEAQGVELARRETAAAHRSAAAAAAQIAALLNQVRMLQARRQLHLALLSLDERNFGTARDHLVTAGRDLSAVQAPPPGSNLAVLSRLAQELQSARLTVTENLAQQRQRILAWVHALDAQFPPEPAAPGSPPAPPGS